VHGDAAHAYSRPLSRNAVRFSPENGEIESGSNGVGRVVAGRFFATVKDRGLVWFLHSIATEFFEPVFTTPRRVGHGIVVASRIAVFRTFQLTLERQRKWRSVSGGLADRLGRGCGSTLRAFGSGLHEGRSRQQ